MPSIHSITPQKSGLWSLYAPTSTNFKMSRSKLELFISCKRCFFLDRKCGIKRPESFPLTLNTAVDELLKKEFDIYRAAQRPHPILIKNGIYAIPYEHPMLPQWRDCFKGIQYSIPKTNILLTAGVDDLWFDLKTGEIIVVDYKATSSNGKIDLSSPWQEVNKRQLEVHQWLLRKNGNAVSKTSYFVYCNGNRNADFFANQLTFEMSLVPHIAQNDCNWVEEMVVQAYECLQSDLIPEANVACKHCNYALSAAKHIDSSYNMKVTL